MGKVELMYLYEILFSITGNIKWLDRLELLAYNSLSAEIDKAEAKCGEFAEISREWNGKTEIEVNLDFETEIVSRPENMVCVRRGALVYSIPIKEKRKRVEYTKDGVERIYPYCDYYIYPQSKCNYALADDKFELSEQEFDAPFNLEHPPVTLTAELVEIECGFNCGHCDRFPKSAEPLSDIQKIKLIPYGCTNLRMTEIPFVYKNHFM